MGSTVHDSTETVVFGFLYLVTLTSTIREAIFPFEGVESTRTWHIPVLNPRSWVPLKEQIFFDRFKIE